MGYPELPSPVKADLASEAMRQHHHLWHLVRRERSWNALSQEERAALQKAHWVAPRFEDQPGAGIDFLGMHREMIGHVNHLLHGAGDAAWPAVVGWSQIPFTTDDPDWPVPPVWKDAPASFVSAKSEEAAAQMIGVAATLESDGYLRSRSLDRMGTDIEFSIHSWMHLRWSAEPLEEPFDLAPENDWLGAPFSSHVNKHFWKLHGWIDGRITAWERANATSADLSEAWSGPGHMMMDEAQTDWAGRRIILSTSDLAVFRIDPELVRALVSATP